MIRTRGTWTIAGGSALCIAMVVACSRDSQGTPDDSDADPDAGPGWPVEPDTGSPGRWRRFRTHRFDENLTAEQRAQIEKLEGVGYASGSVEAVDEGGISIHDPSRAQAGLNLYTSGHAPEAILAGMDGAPLHRWSRDILEVWPEFPVERQVPGSEYWRRAYLYGNGDLLAIFEGLGMIKLDKDSNLLWDFPGRAHHDMEVMPDGDIYVLTRVARIVPSVNPTKPVLEDFITILDPEGQPRRHVSILQAFQTSEFSIQWPPGEIHGDIFHTNTLEVLDGRLADRIPAFRRGNVLVSILRLSMLAVVDVEQGKVVWVHRGDYQGQHDPQVLENGHLLLFDNLGRPGCSSVQELDLVGRKTAWLFRGSPDEPFYSETCGTVQRLANGNTLVTESDNGRAFELTPDKEIVWEFNNPQRAGPSGEYVATLFEMRRLPADFPIGWIDG